MDSEERRIKVGHRIQLDGARGTVRFIGKLQGYGAGQWVGVEWDDPSRGKHSGTHNGRKYFQCAPGKGSFVKSEKVNSTTRRSLLQAARKRYTKDAIDTTFRESMVIIGGGLVSIEDCDETRRQNVALAELRTVDVSDMGVAFVKEVGLTCFLPEVQELRIARSLLSGPKSLLDVLDTFPKLRVLDASSNIFEDTSEDCKERSVETMSTTRYELLEEMILNHCTLSWMTVRTVCARSRNLRTLRLHNCGLGCIGNELQLESMLGTLRILDMDGNELGWESILRCIGKLESLREVYLSSNKLEDDDLYDDNSFTKVETLSLANNALGGWKVISWLQNLSTLRNLRIRGNPVTSAEAEGLDNNETGMTWRMRVIGRLGRLEVLDGSTISRDERILSEKRYMSEEVASGWLKSIRDAMCEHPRAEELYRIYGLGHRPGRVDGMRKQMVRVRLIAAESVSARRESVVREMPRGARMSRVRAVGRRLLGIEGECCAGIRRTNCGNADVEWDSNAYGSRSIEHWISGNANCAEEGDEEVEELCVVIGSVAVMGCNAC